ncbi:MAG TPA: HDIG domain-containing protein [Chthoniobacteraceae bacterium]|jgi:hypothetical protein|nr:HDIG domain-containing protein [Chthoniobacteraceae bacterium]
METLEHGHIAKFVVLASFLIGLAALIYADVRVQAAEKVFIATLIFMTALAQLWINHPQTFAKNSRILLIFSVILLQLAVVKVILITADNQVYSGVAGMFTPAQRKQLWLLAIPYSLAPLILSILLGKNHGLYAATFVSLWGAMIYREIDAIMLVMSLISGFIAVFITLQVRRRSRLVRAGVFVGLATWCLALLFGLIGPISWQSFSSTDWRTVGMQSLIAVGSGIITAFVVGGALPVMESTFRVTTDISWLELADLNHPLLKRMTIEAPGTYHHSLVVANLAEAAAEAIGANVTMCRVCSYFHDIGKLVKADYFTENMRRDRNPHDDLAPTMSALIIIAHVKEGVDLALKHGLNQKIIDVIQQHHGTSSVFYFYKRALQQQEDARAGGKIMNIRDEDIPEVREESFRYPGPRPQTKECAIISLADTIESASRSLERVTPQKIDQLIGDLVQKRLLDGQLKECDLTMRELEEISESFRHTLQSMMHSRVSYPSEKNDKGDRHDTSSHSRTRAIPPASAA